MEQVNIEELNRLANTGTEYINDVEYPAHKSSIIGAARKKGAPADILIVLEQIPERIYASYNDLLALFVDIDES